MRVEDGDGDISVGAVAPVGELGIHNRNGAINLTVPRGAGFEIQATAKNGNIESKLDLPVTSAGQGQSVTGKVGRGGPHIELVADHGDIEINAMDVPPAPRLRLPHPRSLLRRPHLGRSQCATCILRRARMQAPSQWFSKAV